MLNVFEWSEERRDKQLEGKGFRIHGMGLVNFWSRRKKPVEREFKIPLLV